MLGKSNLPLGTNNASAAKIEWYFQYWIVIHLLCFYRRRQRIFKIYCGLRLKAWSRLSTFKSSSTLPWIDILVFFNYRFDLIANLTSEMNIESRWKRFYAIVQFQRFLPWTPNAFEVWTRFKSRSRDTEMKSYCGSHSREGRKVESKIEYHQQR